MTQYRRPQKLMKRALEFYVQWHEFIDSLQVPLIRLEDFNADMVWDMYQHVQSMHAYQPGSNMARLPSTNRTHIETFFETSSSSNMTKTNHRKHRATLTWAELCQVDRNLTRRFWNLAQKYGYYLDNDESDRPQC